MTAYRTVLHFLLAIALSWLLTPTRAADDPGDLQSDTWTATDALGRTLPGFAEVGPPKQGKTVGMFYFLWLGQAGDLGPFDISKILAQDPSAISNPASPLWGPIHSPHHWGESIFGYYVSEDESVLRKHAQMLSNAGVDAIIFDVTNQVTYPRSWKALCRVFDQVRREGNRAPQIAFLCPFWQPSKVVRELWSDLYSKNLYPDLWFRWEGKPLILADPNLLSEDLVQDKHGSSVELKPGHTLGQTFTVDKPFDSVGASLPTWADRNSAVTLTLHRHDPGRRTACHAPLCEAARQCLGDARAGPTASRRHVPSGAFSAGRTRRLVEHIRRRPLRRPGLRRCVRRFRRPLPANLPARSGGRCDQAVLHLS